MSCEGDVGIAVIGGVVGAPLLVTVAGVIIAGAAVLGGAALTAYGAYKFLTLTGKSVLEVLEKRKKRIAGERRLQLERSKARMRAEVEAGRKARAAKLRGWTVMAGTGSGKAAAAGRGGFRGEGSPRREKQRRTAENLLVKARGFLEEVIDEGLADRHLPGLRAGLELELDSVKKLVERGWYTPAVRELRRLMERMRKEAAELERRENRYQRERLEVYELIHGAGVHLESSDNHLARRYVEGALERAARTLEGALEAFGSNTPGGLAAARRKAVEVERILDEADREAAEREAERVRAVQAKKKLLASIVGSLYQMGFVVEEIVEGDVPREMKGSPVAVRMVGDTPGTMNKEARFFVTGSGRLHFEFKEGFEGDECRAFSEEFLRRLADRGVVYYHLGRVSCAGKRVDSTGAGVPRSAADRRMRSVN